MRKPISTEMHGAMDYLTVAALASLPSFLGLSKRLSFAIHSIALGKLLATLFTDNETGLVRKIPMKAHLAMDAVNGATLAALPFVMDEDDEAAQIACVGMGVMEMGAALMTQTTPTNRSLRQDAVRASRRVTRQFREHVGA